MKPKNYAIVFTSPDRCRYVNEDEIGTTSINSIPAIDGVGYTFFQGMYLL